MKSTLANTLEHKLVLILTMSALIFSVLAGVVLFFHRYNQQLEHSRNDLNNLAATAQSLASLAVFVENASISNEVLDGLLRNEEILGVSLESDTGFNIERQRDADDDTKTEVIAYPLYSPASPQLRVGYLKLSSNAGLIAAHARDEAFVQVLTLVAQTVVLALMMILAFRHFVGRPLFDLGKRLQHVSPGEGHRLAIPPQHTHDEIGLLSSRVNTYLEASDHAIVAERELRRRVESMEDHYRRIFESTSIGIMALSTNGALINCNPVLRKRIMRPNTDADLQNSQQTQADFLSIAFKHPDKAWALVKKAMQTEQVATADLELNEIDGRPHWVHCLFSIHKSDDGQSDFIEGVLYDVTSRREREEMALRTAERDPLTDIINRRGAEAFIDRAIVSAVQENTGVTLFYIDLDGFKEVNDEHGHAAGDEVLIEVASRLKSILRRSSDLIARLGGDEFIIIAYDCGKNDSTTESIASNIVAILGQPIRLQNSRVTNVGASVGIAGFPEDGHHRRSLLLLADQAMYQAKKQGKSCYAYAGISTTVQ